MAEITYICNENQHNKFWSYEISGTTVITKWGRIGGTSDETSKNLGSSSGVQKFIATKIREKEKKGYKLASKEKLKEETETANALGSRNKIKQMHFVSRKDNELTKLSSYDPKQYVYVEVMDSWSKEITRLLLSKDDTWQLSDGLTESGDKLIANGIDKLKFGHTYASAIRALLKKMSETVVEVLKSIKFASIGVRSLFDDSDSSTETSPDVQTALASINTAGFEAGVISKFASVGARVLDL